MSAYEQAERIESKLVSSATTLLETVVISRAVMGRATGFALSVTARMSRTHSAMGMFSRGHAAVT
jgi:hypothetical protein